MKERVGARHWLILGMLAQMPEQAMHIKMIGHLAHAYAPGVNVKPTINILLDKGLVMFHPETGIVLLTELGATRRRQSGRPDTPWFARVPDSFIRRAV